MLKFNLADIDPILKHSETALTHKALYGLPKTDKVGLWLVKDEGVYIMSNGLPNLPHPTKSEASLVAYAEGHDPSKGDTWDADRAECGGDDFGEFLDMAAEIRKAITEGKSHMCIRMTPRTFRVTFK